MYKLRFLIFETIIISNSNSKIKKTEWQTFLDPGLAKTWFKGNLGFKNTDLG